MLKKLNLVDPKKDEKVKKLYEDFLEITSFRDIIIERAFKKLPDHLTQYGINELAENFSRLLDLVSAEAELWDKEQEHLELEYRYDGNDDPPGVLEDKMERESEGRYLNNLYKKGN
jgi:hypothetical protein